MLTVEGVHAEIEEDVLCGAGANALKSVLLLLVTEQTGVRIAAVVFESVGVGLPREQFAAVPKPTRSTRLASVVGHAPLKAAVRLTNATLPAVPLKLIVPVASGTGSATVPADPAASWINAYWPGCSEIDGSAVTCQELPVLLAY